MAEPVSSRVIVLMHGSTFAGKSATASFLGTDLQKATGLPTALFQTAQRKAEKNFTIENYAAVRPRTIVYDELAQEIRDHIERHNSGLAIVDGTFSRRDWRNAFYELALQTQSLVIFVSCRCESQDELRARMEHRRVADPDDPVNNLSFLRTELSIGEDLLLDDPFKMPPVVYIINDTLRRRVHSIYGRVSEASQLQIAEQVENRVAYFSSRQALRSEIGKSDIINDWRKRYPEISLGPDIAIGFEDWAAENKKPLIELARRVFRGYDEVYVTRLNVGDSAAHAFLARTVCQGVSSPLCMLKAGTIELIGQEDRMYALAERTSAGFAQRIGEVETVQGLAGVGFRFASDTITASDVMTLREGLHVATADQVAAALNVMFGEYLHPWLDSTAAKAGTLPEAFRISSPELLKSRYNTLRDKSPEADLPSIESCFDHIFERYGRMSYSFSWVHGNLNLRSVIVRSRDFRPYLVDCHSIRRAHPLWDLAIMERELKFRFALGEPDDTNDALGVIRELEEFLASGDKLQDPSEGLRPYPRIAKVLPSLFALRRFANRPFVNIDCGLDQLPLALFYQACLMLLADDMEEFPDQRLRAMFSALVSLSLV